MRQDTDSYSRDELREIESLYQVANKQWGTQEAQQSLERLVKKFGKANRTGCAILYLGQMNGGEKQIQLLEKAMAQFGECEQVFTLPVAAGFKPLRSRARGAAAARPTRGLPRQVRDQPHVAGIAQFYLAVRRDHQTAVTEAANF